VVALGALRDCSIEDAPRRVEERLVCLCDVLLAEVDEALPRRPLGVQRRAIRWQTGRLEQVRPVAHRFGTGVSSKADGLAVGRAGHRPLPGVEGALELCTLGK